MVPVRLENRDGLLVSDEEAILPFDPLPDVLMWGGRVFKLHHPEGARDPRGRAVPVYREAFIYYITGLERAMLRPPSSLGGAEV